MQKHYIPVHLDLPGEKVKWLNIKRFTELPVMNSAAIAALEEYTLETRLDVLTARDKLPGKPSGFIFHTSRCGSTLLTRIIQKAADVLAFNEPQPINSLLVNYTKTGNTVTDLAWEQRGNKLLNSLLSTYLYTQKKVFIKFSSFNLLVLDRITKLWPDVPIVFLYRNPIEVVVSNLEKQGGFLSQRNNPMLKYILNQCNLDLPAHLTNEEYCVKMINSFFSIILHHVKNIDRSDIIAINYETISPDTIPDILRFFKLDVTKTTHTAIAACMSNNAKNGTPFSKDIASKHAKAGHIIRQLCEQYAFENYHALKQCFTR
ncbi:sulfotransferase [Ohtaekwangia koreensis]|uniref:Sulfotransferase family protein n=1 Tax=Ohtaekwangia koreensis TaxID=688867 RepID=A0A1T5KKK8_9BACT|nr:sulfotransferase [Ohtaekwangia koreensis]SKC64276.1 hypothetical protein SAMN05660236_2308 [Ohtaekwangia koreensis]